MGFWEDFADALSLSTAFDNNDMETAREIIKEQNERHEREKKLKDEKK